MPTESAFLLAGLLFIAAALGYVFAKFGDTEDDEGGGSAQLSSDYLKGLNYVLNEQPDRAVELFTRMAELDDEALETHFALGSLFRKRGEVDRAIRVHQNLMARPSLSQAHKDQAEAALAEDYLSAGLFDRAENLFQKLCDSSEFRVAALRRLVRIYEITREWGRAIEVRAELDHAQEGWDREPAPGAEVAHYYCEIAEQARARQDFTKAREMLKHADSCRERTVRSQLARADLDSDSGRYRDALRGYQNVVKAVPHLVIDILPRLVVAYRELDDEPGLDAELRRLIGSDEQHVAAVAMGAIRYPDLDHPVVLDALLQFIAADPTLNGLIGVERIETAPIEERAELLDRVRQALRSIAATKAGYRCTECGYACRSLQWQCPGCRAWETVEPEAQLRLT
jgi:lipopolysaccharide biosynthesis regulator YciM